MKVWLSSWHGKESFSISQCIRSLSKFSAPWESRYLLTYYFVDWQRHPDVEWNPTRIYNTSSSGQSIANPLPMTQTFTFLSLTKTTIPAFTITKRDESLIETCFDSCLILPVKSGAKICVSDQYSRAEFAVPKTRFKCNFGWITYKI